MLSGREEARRCVGERQRGWPLTVSGCWAAHSLGTARDWHGWKLLQTCISYARCIIPPERRVWETRPLGSEGRRVANGSVGAELSTAPEGGGKRTRPSRLDEGVRAHRRIASDSGLGSV